MRYGICRQREGGKELVGERGIYGYDVGFLTQLAG